MTHNVEGFAGGPDQALAGELFSRTDNAGPCQIREWFERGWRRWECVGPGHTGKGEHRTAEGRARGLAEHAQEVADARAADRLAEWVRVQ